jgi:hypothetical protein
VTPAKLRELLALAETRKARDLARLEALIAADRRLADEARGLSGVHARDMAEGAAAAPLALLGRRLIWADARAAAIRAARSRLAAEIATVRSAATVSLGKHRALEHLTERADRAAAAAREARAERDAPPRPGG